MPPAVASKPVRRVKDMAMLPNPRRKPLGRTSLYKPEYCELVERWGIDGKSKAEMCSLLNIGRQTMADWERQHSAFRESLTRAREHAQAWWERKAQQSLGKKQFQAQLWRYSMAGRFKEDYAENKSASGLEALHDLLAAVEEVAQRRAAAMLPGASAKPIEAVLVKDDAKG